MKAMSDPAIVKCPVYGVQQEEQDGVYDTIVSPVKQNHFPFPTQPTESSTVVSVYPDEEKHVYEKIKD